MVTVLAAALSFYAVPPHAPPRDVLLMRVWYGQNERCRGDPEPTVACRWRDDTQRALELRDWRYSSRYGWFRARPAH